MRVIGHQQKERDVPSHLRLIELYRIQNRLRQQRVSQWRLRFISVKSDPDVKQRADFNPMGHAVMQSLGETAINHIDDSKFAFSRAARWNALSSTRWVKHRGRAA